MYLGLELNVETTRHGSKSCFCKITLETTRAEATPEEVTHHSIVKKSFYCDFSRDVNDNTSSLIIKLGYQIVSIAKRNENI